MESRNDSSTDPQRIRGRPFPAGNNASPHGRAAPKVKIRAEAERLIHDFVTAYGRPPTHAEAVQIGTCAMLIVKIASGRSRRGVATTAEDTVKLSNSLARNLRRVGLGEAPTRAPAAPRPSALEVLK